MWLSRARLAGAATSCAAMVATRRWGEPAQASARGECAGPPPFEALAPEEVLGYHAVAGRLAMIRGPRDAVVAAGGNVKWNFRTVRRAAMQPRDCAWGAECGRPAAQVGWQGRAEPGRIWLPELTPAARVALDRPYTAKEVAACRTLTRIDSAPAVPPGEVCTTSHAGPATALVRARGLRAQQATH